MPVAAGRTVSVLGEVTVNCAVDSWQKHNSFPAPEPVELRRMAYRMLVSEAPEAVNARPIDDMVNFIDLADAPVVHCAVAGTRFRPPATYPPVAEISAVI